MVYFIIFCMVYGLIFGGYSTLGEQEQHDGILQFASAHGMTIDEFISYNNNPNIFVFKPGDVIVCYAWHCLCKDRSFLRLFIQHIVKTGIDLYSVTSKYHIDQSMDMDAVRYAFAMYEDIRFNFWSRKTAESASKRLVPGRRAGSRNKKHVLDGKEKLIWDMYNNGASMYAISKKLKVSAPTIKRFLTTQK